MNDQNNSLSVRDLLCDSPHPDVSFDVESSDFSGRYRLIGRIVCADSTVMRKAHQDDLSLQIVLDYHQIFDERKQDIAAYLVKHRDHYDRHGTILNER